MYEYEELTVTMGELQEGDKVQGTDGRWYEIKLLPVHTPKDMFRLELENGPVDCSGDHLWTLFNNSKEFVRETREVHLYQDVYKSFRFGGIMGPKMLSIESIEPVPSRCISLVGSHDNLFKVLTDLGEPIHQDQEDTNIKTKSFTIIRE